MLIGLLLGAMAIRASLKAPGTVLMAAPLAILTLPAFDSAAFARGIETLVVHKTLRRKMGRAGRLHVRTRHDIDKNYVQVESVLRSLTNPPRGSGDLV